jgi:hypothetical protein
MKFVQPKISGDGFVRRHYLRLSDFFHRLMWARACSPVIAGNKPAVNPSLYSGATHPPPETMTAP